MDELSDEELLGLYKRGRTEAFDLLYERHADGLFFFLLRMCASRPLAEELLHDVLFKVARGAQQYDARGRFRPWLYRVASNHCLNVLASAPHRRDAQVVPLSALPSLEPAAAALDGPEAVAEARETRAEVLAAIGELEPRYRAAMVLRELVGLPIDEIAQALEVPVGTVKTLLFRGRERLRRRLVRLAEEVA